VEDVTEASAKILAKAGIVKPQIGKTKVSFVVVAANVKIWCYCGADSAAKKHTVLPPRYFFSLVKISA
jgi:hypothetical protein